MIRYRNQNKENNVYEVAQSVNTAFGRGGSEASQVAIMRKPLKDLYKVAVWNVRTMARLEKLENAKREMKRYGLNLMGLTEVRWKETGDFISNDVRVIHSGSDQAHREVALLLDEKTGQSVTRIGYINDKILVVHLKGNPVGVSGMPVVLHVFIIVIRLPMPLMDAG